MRKITSCSRIVLLTLWLPYWNPSIPHIVLTLTADRHKGEDLQLIMDCDAIGACCRIIIKCNFVHFRPTASPRTITEFYCGIHHSKTMSEYKYLRML